MLILINVLNVMIVLLLNILERVVFLEIIH